MKTQLKIQAIGIMLLFLAYLVVSCTTTQEVKPKPDLMCNVEITCRGSYDGITQCPTKTS